MLGRTRESETGMERWWNCGMSGSARDSGTNMGHEEERRNPGRTMGAGIPGRVLSLHHVTKVPPPSWFLWNRFRLNLA